MSSGLFHLQFLWLWNKCSDRNITSRCTAGIVFGDSNVDVVPAPFPAGDPVILWLLPISGVVSSGTKHVVQTQSPGTMKLNWNSFVGESHPRESHHTKSSEKLPDHSHLLIQQIFAKQLVFMCQVLETQLWVRWAWSLTSETFSFALFTTCKLTW